MIKQSTIHEQILIPEIAEIHWHLGESNFCLMNMSRPRKHIMTTSCVLMRDERVFMKLQVDRVRVLIKLLMHGVWVLKKLRMAFVVVICSYWKRTTKIRKIRTAHPLFGIVLLMNLALD